MFKCLKLTRHAFVRWTIKERYMNDGISPVPMSKWNNTRKGTNNTNQTPFFTYNSKLSETDINITLFAYNNYENRRWTEAQNFTYMYYVCPTKYIMYISCRSIAFQIRQLLLPGYDLLNRFSNNPTS